MKRYCILAIAIMLSLGAYSQKFNISGNLEVDTVVVCNNLTKEQIYSNILQTFSNINGSKSKSIAHLDYSDKNLGIINYKSKLFICFYKVMMYGYNIYADVMINVKCKEGKA